MTISKRFAVSLKASLIAGLALVASQASATLFQLDFAVSGSPRFSFTVDDQDWDFSSTAMLVFNAASGRYFAPGDAVGQDTVAQLMFWKSPSPAVFITAADDLGYDVSYYSSSQIFAASATAPSFTAGTYAMSTANYYWPMNTVFTVSEVAPVPEPAEWAMLATGVVVLGFAARRRRRYSAAASASVSPHSRAR